jgi:hypothetical protein
LFNNITNVKAQKNVIARLTDQGSLFFQKDAGQGFL